jgi:hypothetical protein
MSIRIAGTGDPEVIVEPAPSDLGMQGMSPPTWQAHSRDQDDPPALQLQDNMEGEGIAHHNAGLPSIPLLQGSHKQRRILTLLLTLPY